jgi:hypothetical protein
VQLEFLVMGRAVGVGSGQHAHGSSDTLQGASRYEVTERVAEPASGCTCPCETQKVCPSNSEECPLPSLLTFPNLHAAVSVRALRCRRYQLQRKHRQAPNGGSDSIV